MIFDCDKKELSTPFDDVKSMPSEIVSFMKRQLNNSTEHRDDKFSKIFLGMYNRIFVMNLHLINNKSRRCVSAINWRLS